MSLYKRKHGEEQPYWPLAGYKIRLPFIHYRLEAPEVIQGMVLFTIGLSMIEIMTNVLGISYSAAIAVVAFNHLLMLLPSTVGIPFVSGFITPLIPILVVFLGNYEPGPEAIRALIAIQLAVALIFLILGVTGLGSKFITKLPNSLKGGILLGAGFGAIMGEIEKGGTVITTPYSMVIGAFLCLFIMFSQTFKNIAKNNRFYRMIANYGIMPAILVAIIIGWIIKEYPTPSVEWGIMIPSVKDLWQITPFVVGFPSIGLILTSIPTAILAYVIAYGDIIVGQSLIKRASESRDDEKITYSIGKIHIITAIRNVLNALFVPHPGLAGPIFTAGTATVAERYTNGRKAMDSIYSGTNSLLIAFTFAMLILPLITLFQPFLPIALSITLIITGYLCITLGMQQLKSEREMGVAGLMAITLAMYGAAVGLAVGTVLYFVVEFSNNKKENKKKLKKVA